MKKKMMAVTAGLLACCMLGAGCQIHRSFSSLVPEEYGAWDNYYIYHGNVRSKTTGENGENLVTSVELDGKTYTVNSCDDSAIVGDDIYMCLTLSCVGENGTETENALVAYNVETKTQSLLMNEYSCQTEDGKTYVYRPNSIVRAYEDAELLLYGQRETISLDENGTAQTSYDGVYFTVDYSGAFQKEKTLPMVSGYAQVSEEYFVTRESRDGTEEVTLSYLTFDMEESVPMCTFDNANVYVEYEFVEKNGARGFLLKTYALYDIESTAPYQGERLMKVEFFNLATNTLVPLYEGDSYAVWVQVPSAEYFITYTYENVTYTYKDGMFKKAVEQTAWVQKQCVVQHIVYSADGVSLETAYIFNSSLGLQNVVGVDSGKQLYISMCRYENASLFNKGGYKTERYKVNLAVGEIKQADDDEWNHAQIRCYATNQQDAKCGDYAYYIERIALNTVNNKTSYAYRLQRYDKKNDTADVMQLWKGTGSEEGEKYCQMMWRNNGGDMDEFIVRPF